MLRSSSPRVPVCAAALTPIGCMEHPTKQLHGAGGRRWYVCDRHERLVKVALERRGLFTFAVPLGDYPRLAALDLFRHIAQEAALEL